MKISIAAHGRFHAVDLAAALLRNGQDVQLLASARPSAVARQFPLARTQLLRKHFVLAHTARVAAGGEPPAFVEARLKRMFGGWAARKHIVQHPDVIYCLSGVAEESLQACRGQSLGIVARLSAHIRTQRRLLQEEERRVGQPLEKPSDWIVAREEREYQQADLVMVPSSFARETFSERDMPPERMAVVPLTTRATGFAAPETAIAARRQRLLGGEPLRVLYVGMLSYRKGMFDMLQVLRALSGRMEFRLVGPLLRECKGFAQQAATLARVESAVGETELPSIYAWGDVFLLPTIEDGFGVVLAQAQAAGLPIITTTNSGGPDIMAAGGQGFIVPIRSSEAIIERLRWCDDNRTMIAHMVAALHALPPLRSWDDVAEDFMRAVSIDR